MRKIKTGKRSVKASGKQQMEKQFLHGPAKWASQITKEVNVSRKKEDKLVNAISKVKSQLKTAEIRVRAAKNNANKKQLNVAKKTHGNIVKTHLQLSNQLQEIKKTLEALANKQAKVINLRKQLSQFESEWTKVSRKPSAKAKVKTTKQKISRMEPPTVKQPQHEPVEMTLIENVMLDEATKIAS